MTCTLRVLKQVCEYKMLKIKEVCEYKMLKLRYSAIQEISMEVEEEMHSQHVGHEVAQ